MLRDIQGQAGRLVALVDDLLTVGKIESDKLNLHKVTFNPKTLIENIVRDFQQGSATHKIVISGTLSYPVRADKELITQVFINLLTNAVKYSPRADKVLVRIARLKNKCVISIQDFGSGIAKKDQKDIFTRFFRASDAGAGNVSGLGLGLYISKGIIKKHHERLWVKSIEGKGTTLFFTLSLA
ncbi:MAG: multi-sensor signal transduction histidine kinase [Parcubacteria group bacterium Gr01-1014_56]|nr:MAG: multi-sensor signal transduction histidine kinase [Parcubacteria group bacterium Gr01-1014_56]